MADNYYFVSETEHKEYDKCVCIIFSGKQDLNIVQKIRREYVEYDILVIELDAKNQQEANKVVKRVYDIYYDAYPYRTLLVGTYAAKCWLKDRYDKLLNIHGALLLGDLGEVLVATFDTVNDKTVSYLKRDLYHFCNGVVADISTQYIVTDTLPTIDDSSLVYLDIETRDKLDFKNFNTLELAEQNEIKSIQIAVNDGLVCYIPEPTSELLQELYNTLRKTNSTLVIHNANFDAIFLTVKSRCDYTQIPIWDTMLLARARGLDDVGLKHLACMYTDLHPLSYEIEHKSFSKEYAVADILVMRDVYKRFVLKGHKQVDYLSRDVLGAFLKSKYVGIKLDNEEAHKQAQEHTECIEHLSNELLLINANINWNSAQQVIQYLRRFNVKFSKKTATNQPSLDSSVLEELTNHNDGRVSEVATRLLDIRKSEKLLKNYYSKYIDTAYLHPDMHVLGADTGRTTSSNPSIQNVPLAVRKTFTSRFEHGKIASFDLDRNELVCAVLLSGDEVMAKALLEYDYHTYVASIAFGVEYDKVTKEQRKIAKIVTFGALLYGGSARGIAHRVGVEKEIVQGAIDKVKASFKKLTHYQDNQIEYAQNHLRIIDCFGKIRDLRMVNQFGSYGAVQRDAMNTPVQGLGGYICLMLYSYIHKRLIDENMQSVLIFQVHDEIIADVPFDEIERFKEIKEEAFRWLNNHEYLRQLPGYGLIKFSGDLSFGNNVLEAKESGE